MKYKIKDILSDWELGAITDAEALRKISDLIKTDYIANDVKIYDNGGKTVDRYTVLIRVGDEWEVYTMSLNALAVDGINSYNRNVSDIKEAITKDDKEIEDIPPDVYEAIKIRL